MNTIIKVENYAQKALLENELLGQFSDGFWENSSNNSWKFLDTVIISKNNTGVVFDKFIPFDYKGYSVNNSKLLSYVGDRMLLYARVATALELDDISPISTLINYLPFSPDSSFSEIDVNSILSDWNYNKSDEFWAALAVDASSFISSIGGINAFVDSLNYNYSFNNLRSDLRTITKILKNTSVSSS
jgi:hypothetical protein